MKKLLVLAFFASFFFACGTDYIHEDYKILANKQWVVDSVAAFPFTITEPTQKYNLVYTIRNTLRYPYYNLFITYELVDASGKILATKRLDANLLNPKTGEPYGTGLGDMYDHEFSLVDAYQFSKAGTYTLKLKQEMRLDTLPEIVAVGVKVKELGK